VRARAGARLPRGRAPGLLRRGCELGDLEACRSPSDYFTPAVAAKLRARADQLLRTRSCGQGGIDFDAWRR